MNILHTTVHPNTFRKVLDTIACAIDAPTASFVCVSATHLVMEAYFDKPLQRNINTSLLTVPDGMPLVWLLRIKGYQTDRIYGHDLFFRLAELAVKKKLTVFLIGGSQGQSQMIKQKLMGIYKTIQITGAIDTPHRPLSSQDTVFVLKKIKQAKPDLILVGMGCPYQEKWITQHYLQFNHGVFVGIGSAFDFVAGYKKQAPRWIGAMGLEWLYRLVQEPSRLWYRYLILSPLFVLLVLLVELKVSFGTIVKNTLHSSRNR